MKTLSLILLQQEKILTTSNYVTLILVEILLAGLFGFMIYKICQMLNPKEGEPSKKSTCRLITIISFVAWIVIALIVWEVFESQMLGVVVGGM